MDAFIYFKSQINIGLDTIEDAIEARLMGLGEVTGSGIGAVGSNIDVFIEDEEKLSKEQLLSIVREVLQEFGILSTATIKIDGDRFDVTA